MSSESLRKRSSKLQDLVEKFVSRVQGFNAEELDRICSNNDSEMSSLLDMTITKVDRLNEILSVANQQKQLKSSQSDLSKNSNNSGSLDKNNSQNGHFDDADGYYDDNDLSFELALEEELKNEIENDVESQDKSQATVNLGNDDINDEFDDFEDEDELVMQLEAAEVSFSSTDNDKSVEEDLDQPVDPIYLRTLKKYFGYSKFRKMQWKIINAILNLKKDNCVVMPTGHGKSLCYQFPSVFTGRTSVVISPLLSLMQDQVLALNTANIPACCIDSSQTNVSLTIDQLFSGEYRFLYITPEYATLNTQLIERLHKKIGIDVIAIDEAHCVSQWGHDFRSAYRKLGKLRLNLSQIPVVALTATATPDVMKDICNNLKLVHPVVTCTGFDSDSKQKHHCDLSSKNVALPSKKSYLNCLHQKTEVFVKRLRWRAFLFEQYTENIEWTTQQYQMNTDECPPPNILLQNFEDDLLKIIDHIKFKNYGNCFKGDLKSKIERENIIVPSPMHENSKPTHHKFLPSAVTNNYKKSNILRPCDINAGVNEGDANLKIENKFDSLSLQNTDLTVKDHKPICLKKPTARLSKPRDTDISRISNHILAIVIPQVKKVSALPLWNDIKQVITWFESLSNYECTFIKLSIKEFYTSVCKQLLFESLNFAKIFSFISNSDINFFIDARKSVLCNENSTEMVEQSNVPININLGGKNTAEISDIVRLYILNKIATKFPFLVGGLYRDNGLFIVRNFHRPKMDEFQKAVHLLFESFDLRITIETSFKFEDYYDMIWNLSDDSLSPLPKSDESLHPNDTLLENESSQKNSSITNPVKKRTRRRKVIWYEPPFNHQVATPIAKKFLNLLPKHFPPSHRYYKFINKHTIKIRYSTTLHI